MSTAGAQRGDVVGMVLCAGLGTRLRPITERIPKPAVPVCGVPLIRWNLALLRGAGIRRAVINTHHLAAEMAEVAREAAEDLHLQLSVSHEPVIAGTGGALREARKLLDGAGAVVLVNGDILFDVDVAAALEAHRRSGALASMVLMEMPAGASYAAVETDPGARVRRIAGRFGPGGIGLTPWHFTGVHVISAEVLDQVAAEPFERDVNRHVYPALMERGLLRGHVVAGYWNDLGTPARYLEASGDVLAGRVSPARFAGTDPLAGFTARAPGVLVHPGASVAASAALTAPCAIGAGASVGAGAQVGPAAFVDRGGAVGQGARVLDAAIWAGTAVADGERVQHAIAFGDLRVGAGPAPG